MHSLNDSCCDALPVFDKWTQPVRVKYETDSIARGYRIAPRKESKKALCTRINLQHVPISVHDKHGIGLKLRHEKLHRVARRACVLSVDTAVRIKRCVARSNQQSIAFAQWNLQSLGKTQDHLPARLGATRLDAAQMTSRDICIKRQVQLANVPNLAPTTQQNAKICIRHCSRDWGKRGSLPDYKHPTIEFTPCFSGRCKTSNHS